MKPILQIVPFVFFQFGLFLTIVPANGQAQGHVPLLSTRLFNARDGLPDNKVTAMLETHKSPYLWAITLNELCRFDGYRFITVWEKLPEIAGLTENSRGELVMWHIHEAQQLSVFEPSTGKKTVRNIAEISGLRGNLVRAWAQDTMFFMTTETLPNRQFEVYRLFPNLSVQFLYRLDLSLPELMEKMTPKPVLNFHFDEKGNALWCSGIFFGQADCGYQIDIKTGRSIAYPLPQSSKNPENLFWIVSPSRQLYSFSSQQNQVWGWNPTAKKFDIAFQKPSPFSGLDLVGADKKGALIFKKNGKFFDDFWLLRSDGSWLDLKNLLPKFKFNAATGADFSRQIYFSTLEGVLRVNFEQPLFSKFIPEKPAWRDFLNPAFRGIAADQAGNIWMMSEMIDLFRLRPDGSTEAVPVRDKTSGKNLLLDNAVNFQPDAEGNLWTARNVETDFNLARIDPKTMLADTFSIKKQRVTTFLAMKNGSVLVAGNDDKSAKIFLFNPAMRQTTTLAEAGKDENFKTSPLYFLERTDGKVWVGSNNGLSLFNPATRQWLDFQGNNETAHEFPVAVIVAEGENVLWLGTLGGGLRKLSWQNVDGPASVKSSDGPASAKSSDGPASAKATAGKWEIFTMRDGLPSNKIAGILLDENQNLWISTFNGLSFFQKEARLFTNFFTENGLSNNEFNRFSFFKSPDGRMYFGGLFGVSFFQPSEVLQSFSQGNDSLLISQIAFFASDGKTKIEQIFDLQNLQEITLPPENRFLSIQLALSNYLLPEANRFAWRLEGYSDAWHLNGTNNDITFDYLPAGTYRLHLKAANPTGVWGKDEHTLIIEVREFWYKTWWAISGFSLTLLGLFYFFYKNQVRLKLEQAENLKIKEIDTLKTRLYTNITHEFRTPLTVILGMAEEIEELEQGKKSPVMNAAQLIRRNGKNLLRLINQLLDLSKLDSGLMKTTLVQAEIIGYLQYLTESFYSMAQERKIRLTFYPESPSLMMDFDEEKMQVIVFNLLSNALKFTGEGGKVVLHATAIQQNTETFLQLKIQDTGVGISALELPHIFDRFYQADNSNTRKSEGTGIGLALTKELVELAGGSIAVESTLGKGTQFTVLFPVRRSVQAIQSSTTTANSTRPWQDAALHAEHHIPSEWPEGLKSSDEAQTDKPLLLIIEDNPDVIAYIVGLLKSNYQIETAANGKTGIETAFEIVPDIIISDVMMPEKDGYEVCDTLKKDERTSHIPIILLTAKATQEDKVAGLRVGADAYLRKPFDKSELFVRLEKLVELRKRMQEQYAGFGDRVTKPLRFSNPEKASPSLDDLFLQKIRQAIETKMSDTELGILHLCRAVHLSHTQVFRKLKALTGENPTLYIRKMRLERAHELLKTTQKNVSEIAYEVGFSDPNYFSRTFHEAFGVAPSAMRK